MRTLLLIFVSLKIYYRIPDSANDNQNKIIDLEYQNFRLKILLAVQPMEKIYAKYNGKIFIDRIEENGLARAEIRYEDWPPEVELLLKFCIGKMASERKVR